MTLAKKLRLAFITYLLLEILGGTSLFLIPFAPAVASAQSLPLSAGSFSAGVFYSPAYNFGGNPNVAPGKIYSGNPASGSATIQLYSPTITLPDGRVVVPYATNVPITVDAGSNQETVTPSAVSGCYIGAPLGSCTITATFSNVHGEGAIVMSGDSGLQEAINDASNNGGGMVFWLVDTGSVTLSTSGATTNLCTSCIPVNAIVLGVVARVTTTIGTCTGGWELGDGTTATRFTAANTTLTAGTVSAADLQTTSGVASTTTGMYNITTAKNLVNTCVTANASAGAIHARMFGYVLATPNF